MHVYVAVCYTIALKIPVEVSNFPPKDLGDLSKLRGLGFVCSLITNFPSIPVIRQPPSPQPLREILIGALITWIFDAVKDRQHSSSACT